MQASADSLAFIPPREPAAFRGFALAIVAHLLLLLALTWGISWKSDDRNMAVEAELWSSMPQEAAPPPAPPQPEVTPPPPPVVQPAPPPPVAKQPDINLEREKRKREEDAKRREEEELRKQQLEAQKREQEAQQHKLEEQQRLAEEKKQKEELARKDKQKQELEAKKREQLRKETMSRMMAEATGNGAPDARGTAAKSSGPSDSYGGRIRARVQPNIHLADEVPGNPSAEVEVRMAPDGTIVSRRITKPSGVQSWDEAVLRALDITEVLPRDIDGRVHTPLIIVFSRRG